MKQPRFTNWQVFDEVGRRKYLSTVERARFLAVAERMPPRICALCHVLAFTGCRITEALRLTPNQLNEGMLTLATLKRRKLHFRLVPVPRGLTEMLEALVGDGTSPYFPWHRATAWRHVSHVMQRAGVAGPMACCRGLRHTFGMFALARGVPANLVQRWLGHASPTTTAIYLNAVGIEEREFAGRMW